MLFLSGFTRRKSLIGKKGNAMHLYVVEIFSRQKKNYFNEKKIMRGESLFSFRSHTRADFYAQRFFAGLIRHANPF